MLKVLWNPTIFETGIDIVDLQHKDLFRKLNELYNLLSTDCNKEEVMELFLFFEKYTVDHFNYEESLMDQFNYPETDMHKLEHEKFINDVIVAKEEFETTGLAKQISLKIYSKVYRLLCDHTSEIDKRMSVYLIKYKDEITKFLPSKRVEKSVIISQNNNIRSQNFIKEILNSFSNVALVINKERQIIYTNDNLYKLLNIQTNQDILGCRPGEVFNCIHANNKSGGCGTSEYCKYCGAANAIIESQEENKKVKYECMIKSKKDGNDTDYDLEITASPFSVNNAVYTIISIDDISDRKRKSLLENIFFHDVMNTATIVNGLIEIIQSQSDNSKSFYILRESSRQLLEEIKSQRDLMLAENGKLEVEYTKVNLNKIFEVIVEQYKDSKFAKDKKIIIDTHNDIESVETDEVLLKRIIANLIKNALEASNKGNSITIGADKIENNVIEINIHNETFMSDEIKKQIFQRSFSTKGKNRGIGTYSIKLLTEKYLGGSVRFESEKENGTIFTICIPERISY